MTIVYHSGNTRSRRVLWVLEELGVAYEGRPVKFPAKLMQPEFLEISPTGMLPAFQDGDVTLTESMAICEYLAVKHGGLSLTVGADEPGYADYLQYLHYGEASLATMVAPIVRYTLLVPEAQRQPAVVADYRQIFIERLEPIRRTLADGRKYLAAGRFTLADVSVGYALMLATLLGMGEALTGDLKAYDDRLRARPAYAKAHAVP
jgi:glutathione S-transferase